MGSTRRSMTTLGRRRGVAQPSPPARHRRDCHRGKRQGLGRGGRAARPLRISHLRPRSFCSAVRFVVKLKGSQRLNRKWPPGPPLPLICVQRTPSRNRLRTFTRRVDSHVIVKTTSTRGGIARTPSPRPRQVELVFTLSQHLHLLLLRIQRVVFLAVDFELRGILFLVL